MSNGCNEYQNLSRRQVLGRGAVAGAAMLTMPAWMPRISYAQGTPRDVMIIVWLGGGMDGLSLCVPYGDANYYVHRTTEAVPPPTSSDTANRCRDLNGFFGLHPSWDPLRSVWDDTDLVFVHATGAGKTTWTRSHFDAARWMELGKINDLSVADGWMGRHLQTSTPMAVDPPLRGISMTYGVMDTLRGGPQVLPIPYPEYFGYDGWYPDQPEMINWLKSAYAATSDPLKTAGRNTTNTVDVLQAIDFENYSAGGGAVYESGSEIARSMRASAAIIKAQIGVETIMVDFGGWDTHSGQGTNGGYFAQHQGELARALKALYLDLMAAGVSFTLVGMSEFGRKVIQNADGHDHGTGNCMFLMGPAVIGRRVVRNWPGLDVGQLFEEQDLKVTIDYRDVVAEVVQKRLKNNNLSTIFPGYTPIMRGLVDP